MVLEANKPGRLFIDHVDVGEIRDRLDRDASLFLKGSRAADALLWFKEHAFNCDLVDVLKVEAKVVASGTPLAEQAQSYIRQAAPRVIADIIAAAIEMAKVDLQHAEKVRKE